MGEFISVGKMGQKGREDEPSQPWSLANREASAEDEDDGEMTEE